MKLSELTEPVKDAVLTGDGEIEINNLEYDSRLVKPQSLFFAVKGFKQDGYDYAASAKELGAVAIMGERDSCEQFENHIQVPDIRVAMAEVAAKFYDYPGMKIKVCGVTGTNGKTTTCYLLRAVLEAKGKKVGMVTSSVYDTGDEQFKAERTTPEALDMQRLMLLMKKNNCAHAVVEVSSHALELERVEHLNFRVAIFTNLTRDHLDFHGTMENYLKAKAKLLKKLNGSLSYAVINIDVPEFRALFGDFNSAYLSYSLKDNSADVYCSDYQIKPEGTIFDLVTPMGTKTIDFKLPGRFNLMNGIAAAAGGLACAVDLDSVVKGLEDARPVPGRFSYVESGQPFAIYVDYAHTPDAIERLCEAARELVEGKIFILFGCGGDRDKGKRKLMGKAATEGADFAIVTSDNPRSEEPEDIIKEIKRGLVKKKFEIEVDRKLAISKVLKMAGQGDAVLLAGKGSENYQEIKGERFPFDDTAVALSVLAEMGYSKVGNRN